MGKGADIIMSIGKSGLGKSSSLRDMPPKETIVVKPNAKSYPFPGGDTSYVEGTNQFTTDAMSDVKVIATTKMKGYKYLVVEDLNHFFNARTTSKSFIAQNSGGAAFAKWNVFASDVIQNFVIIASRMPVDTYIIIIAHTEIKDDGSIGLSTSGKLLDNNLYLPSYATYVLHATILGEGATRTYNYITNADGKHLAKSPAGVFDLHISSNMYEAIKRINDYKQGNVNKIVWK